MATMVEREGQVIRGLAAGRTFSQIALDLGLSPRTIKGYADRLRSRLGVQTAREIPEAWMRATGENPYPASEGAAA